MKRILFILFFLPIFGCGQNGSIQKQPSAFESLVKNVGTINLPLSHRSGVDFEVIAKADTELLAYFPPLYPDDLEQIWHIAGKVSENKNYVAFLSVNTYADFAIPYLITFTKQGKLITKFELYDTICGEDEFYYGVSTFTINKDLSINVNDSTAEYKRDSAGEIIKASIISKSDHNLFKLMNDGTIVQDKSVVK